MLDSSLFAQSTGKFVQRDLTELVQFVASQTDTNYQDIEDHQLWESYLNQPHPSVNTMQRYFQEGVPVNLPNISDIDLSYLHGDSYLENIFDRYVPELLATLKLEIAPDNTALIGSSMGGLSTLYAMHKHPKKFTTALALSPHWPIGGNELVERTIAELPQPGRHKVWMSRGTKGLDAEYEPFQLLADKLMHDKGYQLGRNYSSKVFKKTGHNESSWASYLDQPLHFWLAD